ncbi:hypothetical protein EJ02DRAFT_486482 [Clathrospora elynae]|uniref:Uncharacterized protein n=1 Tax=Clathrospora elynae TaxID=706981 RepID=A0A6A5S3J3_9PLEO|nr:hypothetical protein EJ02DRAFT_486482 [Clathrospora elynae]
MSRPSRDLQGLAHYSNFVIPPTQLSNLCVKPYLHYYTIFLFTPTMPPSRDRRPTKRYLEAIKALNDKHNELNKQNEPKHAWVICGTASQPDVIPDDSQPAVDALQSDGIMAVAALLATAKMPFQLQLHSLVPEYAGKWVRATAG